MIALLHAPDPEFVNEASKRGVFAHITDREPDRMAERRSTSSLRRFAEYHDLEGAFGRRSTIERAKGILMERHSVDEEEAFAMLRDAPARPEPQARRHRRRRGRRRHPLLPKEAASERLARAARPVGDQGAYLVVLGRAAQAQKVPGVPP